MCQSALQNFLGEHPAARAREMDEIWVDEYILSLAIGGVEVVNAEDEFK